MRGLSRKACVEAGVLIEEHSFRKGDLLLREGEHASQLRVIKVGTVYLGRSGSGERINPVGIFGQGTVVGMCSYFGQANQFAAVAATSGRYCEISAHAVASLARKDQKVWDQIGQMYGGTIGLLAKWTVAISRPHIAERVGSCLRLLSEVHRSLTVLLPSHVALAHLLGTTRESVARALALLEADGCITRRGGRVCAVMPVPLAQWLSRQPSA
jgi:CRP-like cAMP-binding protein